MTLEWASDDTLGDAIMLPMDEPSWDALKALPDGTELCAIFVAPFGIAMRAMHFRMNERNRAQMDVLRNEGRALPAYCTYVLPPVEVPNPEDFFTAHRKDADTDE